MWPFENKPRILFVPPVYIGEKFKYIGIEMICTRHWYYDSDAIVADYVDCRGVVKSHVFFPCDWDALKAELVRNND